MSRNNFLKYLGFFVLFVGMGVVIGFTLTRPKERQCKRSNTISPNCNVNFSEYNLRKKDTISELLIVNTIFSLRRLTIKLKSIDVLGNGWEEKYMTPPYQTSLNFYLDNQPNPIQRIPCICGNNITKNLYLIDSRMKIIKTNFIILSDSTFMFSCGQGGTSVIYVASIKNNNINITHDRDNIPISDFFIFVSPNLNTLCCLYRNGDNPDKAVIYGYNNTYFYKINEEYSSDIYFEYLGDESDSLVENKKVKYIKLWYEKLFN